MISAALQLKSKHSYSLRNIDEQVARNRKKKMADSVLLEKYIH